MIVPQCRLVSPRSDAAPLRVSPPVPALKLPASGLVVKPRIRRARRRVSATTPRQLRAVGSPTARPSTTTHGRAALGVARGAVRRVTERADAHGCHTDLGGDRSCSYIAVDHGDLRTGGCRRPMSGGRQCTARNAVSRYLERGQLPGCVASGALLDHHRQSGRRHPPVLARRERRRCYEQRDHHPDRCGTRE